MFSFKVLAGYNYQNSRYEDINNSSKQNLPSLRENTEYMNATSSQIHKKRIPNHYLQFNRHIATSRRHHTSIDTNYWNILEFEPIFISTTII